MIIIITRWNVTRSTTLIISSDRSARRTLHALRTGHLITRDLVAAQLITLRIHMGGMAGLQMGQNGGLRLRRPSSNPAGGRLSSAASAGDRDRLTSPAGVRRGLSVRSCVRRESAKLSPGPSPATVRRGLSVRECGSSSRENVNEAMKDKTTSSSPERSARAGGSSGNGGSGANVLQRVKAASGEGTELRSLEIGGSTTPTVVSKQGESSASRGSAQEGMSYYELYSYFILYSRERQEG